MLCKYLSIQRFLAQVCRNLATTERLQTERVPSPKITFSSLHSPPTSVLEYMYTHVCHSTIQINQTRQLHPSKLHYASFPKKEAAK